MYYCGKNINVINHIFNFIENGKLYFLIKKSRDISLPDFFCIPINCGKYRSYKILDFV